MTSARGDCHVANVYRNQRKTNLIMSPFETILVGVDLSDGSLTALRLAAQLTKKGGKVFAVQAIEREMIELQMDYHEVGEREAIGKIQNNLAAFVAKEAPMIEPHVVIGSAYHALADMAVEVGADLLVLGARGWDHYPGDIGNVASRCVRQAPLPVLLARPSQKEVSFEKLMVCTDFSEAASEALKWGLALQRAFGGRLDLLHVDAPAWLLPAHVQFKSEHSPENDYQQAHRASVRQLLIDQLAECGGEEGEKVVIHVREDLRVARAVSALAHEVGTDLIIVGSHGRNAFNRLWLGTTAERLLHRSPCSVLALRANEGKRESLQGKSGES